MEKLISAFLAIFGVTALVFVIIILTTFMGAVVGWVVGLFFERTILDTLARFGVNVGGMTMWQLGATLAFVGSFFRAHQHNAKAK